VRFLLINNHCISDPTVGVTQSLRTLLRWLIEAGHECQALTTARVESPDVFDIARFLRGRGVPVPSASAAGSRGGRRKTAGGPRAVVHYHDGRVPVTLLMTRHHDETRPDREETAQFIALVERALTEFGPDVLIACNAHPMILGGLSQARRRAVTTTFAVRSYGYDDPRYFVDVDRVFTCSRFLSEHYRRRSGLESTPLEPPIDWSSVLAPEEETRGFVTFVHPAPHKGLFLFARLAAMLGARRPDIPVLVVQSGHSAGALNGIPGIDFSAYPQIMAAPAVSTPAEYFALTRLLLVPSVWDEPFGRVAAEAMINGIPALVSERGGLPDVIHGDAAAGGGGRVLPIPAWMTSETARVPDDDEVAPWFDAVCALWDDANLYRSLAARARRLGEMYYGEARSRAQHLEFFTSVTSSHRSTGLPPIRDESGP
jgi:glycosyltransferase involved in cell wall biosynthesis